MIRGRKGCPLGASRVRAALARRPSTTARRQGPPAAVQQPWGALLASQTPARHCARCGAPQRPWDSLHTHPFCDPPPSPAPALPPPLRQSSAGSSARGSRPTKTAPAPRGQQQGKQQGAAAGGGREKKQRAPSGTRLRLRRACNTSKNRTAWRGCFHKANTAIHLARRHHAAPTRQRLHQAQRPHPVGRHARLRPVIHAAPDALQQLPAQASRVICPQHRSGQVATAACGTARGKTGGGSAVQPRSQRRQRAGDLNSTTPRIPGRGPHP